MRLRPFAPGLALAGVLVGVAVAAYFRPPPAPRSWDDIRPAAAAHDLRHVPDAVVGGVPGRIILSAGPITEDEVRDLPVRPDHPAWAGRVGVYRGWRTYAPMLELYPEHTGVWGDFFLLGDPALIRDLCRDGGE
jgi:hypothetical protein